MKQPPGLALSVGTTVGMKAETAEHIDANAPGTLRHGFLSHQHRQSTPSAPTQKTPHAKTMTDPNPASLQLNPATLGTTKHTCANATGAPAQGNLSSQRDPSTPMTSVQTTSHLNTKTNLNPAYLQVNTATPGITEHIGANGNTKPMLKPTTPKSKHQASESPAYKKRGMEIQATAITLRGMGLVIFKPTKSFNGTPAFMGGFANNLESINQEPENNNIVGVYTLPSGVPYDRVAVAILEVQEGETPMDAVERQGMAFAKAMEKYTDPYKKGNIVGMKIICNFAYIENDQPEYLNAVVGNNNASRIIAQIFQHYIEDGTFWTNADDIIATYFDNTINPGWVKKMIQYASKSLLD